MADPNPRARGARFAFLALLIGATAWGAHATSSHRIPPVVDTLQTVVAPLPPPAKAPVIEVAFVLDTTGSMSGLIEGAKQKIWSVANQLASGSPTPKIRIALVGYRDRGDAYVTRIHGLTDDIDGVYAKLQAFEAGGGGDTPESVNQALHEAVNHLGWSSGQDVYKVIFLVGDAPPHLDYQDDVQYTTSVRLARERGIVVNTVQCGTLAEATPIWREIASSGSGRYAAIRQDGGMLALETPHDADLARLNAELGDTVVAYGGASDRAEIEAKRNRALAADAPAAASRLGFLAKTGGRVNSGKADLLDALNEGMVALDEVAPDALPEPLRELSRDEREAFVADKQEKRKSLLEQIRSLSRQRDDYVSQEQKRRAEAGEDDGFDQEVLGAIKDQAASKGITY
jgi:hypothetical protein